MRIREIMTRDLEVIHPNDMLQDAAERMRSLNVGSLPVCDGDRLVGMVTDRDVTVRATATGQDPKQTTVRDAMTSGEVIYIFEDQDVREAAQLMEQRQVRRLPVLSREKRLVGIVALGNLAVESGDEQLSGEVLERVSEPAEPER